MIEVIKCKNDKVFSATLDGHQDAEWKLQVIYYKAQGCKIEKIEPAPFEKCSCSHCEVLTHNYDTLIDEIRNC